MENNTDVRDVGNEELARLFHRASKMMARSYHRHSHAHHAQARVYDIIRQKGSMSQAELLQMLDVRSSSLSEVLGKLEQGGLITREKNENDKRSYILSVKEGAIPPFGDHEQCSAKGANALFSCLDEQERNLLGSLLRKIIQAAAGADGVGDCDGHHKSRHLKRKKMVDGVADAAELRTEVYSDEARGRDAKAHRHHTSAPQSKKGKMVRGKGWKKQ